MVMSVMILDEGFNRSIRCRFICDWFRAESYVCSNARLFLEIQKRHPDVVVMDLDLYARIDGIETSKKIRTQLVFLWFMFELRV
jgi:CheY-like chemotaxis protein